VITGVVSCPHPPLLLAGATGGVVDEVETLRAACLRAVSDLLADGPELVVLIGGVRPEPAGVWYDPDEPALSLRVGRELLAGAGCALPTAEVAVAGDAGTAGCVARGTALAAELGRQRVALLVLADGSARRGLKAPGYLDPRAAEFDAAIERALLEPDPAALAALDAALGAELLVAGRAAWQVLAGAVADQPLSAECYYSEEPFGVWYPVVRWR
jgi:hypothetical protein